MGSVFYKRVEYFLDKRIVILENKGRREMGLGRERTGQGRGQAELGRFERMGETS